MSSAPIMSRWREAMKHTQHVKSATPSSAPFVRQQKPTWRFMLKDGLLILVGFICGTYLMHHFCDPTREMREELERREAELKLKYAERYQQMLAELETEKQQGRRNPRLSRN